MLLEHLFSLLGSWYFPNLVGKVPFVIDELENGIVVGVSRFVGRQDGEPVAVVPDDQII